MVRYNYRHDRISAIAALTVAPRRARMGLYARFRQRNLKAPDVALFLRRVLRHLRGPVLLLWDRGSIHRGPALTELRAEYPRLHIEWFPRYAPELNPTEQVWNDFKGRTANGLPRHKQDLRLSLHANTRRVRRSGDKLRSFVVASDLPSLPWA